MTTKHKVRTQTAAHESENHLKAGLSDAKDQVVSGFGKDFFSQLLGIDSSSGSNEQSSTPYLETKSHKDDPGEIFNFKKHKNLDKHAISRQKFTQLSQNEQNKYATESKKPEIKAAIDYTGEILRSREHISKQEIREIDNRIKQIMDELKKLVATSRILQMQFAGVGVEQKPVSVGQYHLNFFELLLSLIQAARKNTEDAGAWLQTTGNKNAKKQHKQFMKQGAKVTLSNERAVATQIG